VLVPVMVPVLAEALVPTELLLVRLARRLQGFTAFSGLT
jgi:hypothetical protein